MQFHIENMTCGGCACGVTRAIHTVDPAANVEADPPKRKVVVTSGQPRAAAGHIFNVELHECLLWFVSCKVR